MTKTRQCNLADQVYQGLVLRSRVCVMLSVLFVFRLDPQKVSSAKLISSDIVSRPPLLQSDTV